MRLDHLLSKELFWSQARHCGCLRSLCFFTIRVDVVAGSSFVSHTALCGATGGVWFVASVGCLGQHAPKTGQSPGAGSFFAGLCVVVVVLFENCIVDASIFFIFCDFVVI